MSEPFRQRGNELYVGATGRGIEPLSGGDERAQRGQHD